MALSALMVVVPGLLLALPPASIPAVPLSMLPHAVAVSAGSAYGPNLALALTLAVYGGIASALLLSVTRGDTASMMHSFLQRRWRTRFVRVVSYVLSAFVLVLFLTDDFRTASQRELRFFELVGQHQLLALFWVGTVYLMVSACCVYLMLGLASAIRPKAY